MTQLSEFGSYAHKLVYINRESIMFIFPSLVMDGDGLHWSNQIDRFRQIMKLVPYELQHSRLGTDIRVIRSDSWNKTV